MFNLTVDSILKDFKSKVEKLYVLAEKNEILAKDLQDEAAIFIAEANENLSEATRARKAAKQLEKFLNE